MKVKVQIEEILSKVIHVNVPDDITDIQEVYYYIQKFIKDAYFNQEIILTADDYSGTTQINILLDDDTSGWIDL